MLVLAIIYYFLLPKKLFDVPYATVVLSKEEQLLGAKIAKDGQWRFPERKDVPEKFKHCILEFEDAYFYYHLGFNPVSITKSLYLNIKSGKTKRGGSTLTQQVIRLHRKGKKRTYSEKLYELILATRLEFRHSKDEILALYASHAPYGGNVIGLDMAAWRYFRQKPENLSWAESATLAVLPNAPSLIYPGKNQERLLKKRNRLLQKLHKEEIIDSLTYQLAILEELPQKTHRLPQVSPHFVEKVHQQKAQKTIKTTLDYELQNKINSIVERQYRQLSQNKIYNIAVLVLDVETRDVLAYVGNTPTTKKHQKDVDIITKPRSTGSILKPILYAGMLDDGSLLPKSLIADIPIQYKNYKPSNFHKDFDGAVPADEALSRSLNIPAVISLRKYGLQKFYDDLKKLNFTNIRKHPDHYGLSLILGGAESNLWDLTRTYAGFAGTVNHFVENESSYFSKEFVEPNYIFDQKVDFGKKTDEKPIFDASSMYLTFKALNKVERPEGFDNWNNYVSAEKVAWKTGTSFGFRDAWAIGTTKKYTVGVWVGNADGEGRPGLVGVKAAAPVLFSVFDILPNSDWFSPPLDDLYEAEVCEKSGKIATIYCDEKSTELLSKAGLETLPCNYHKRVHLDETEQFQVNSSCEPLTKIVHKNYFILPPLMEFYYKKKNVFYKTLPKFRNDCVSEEQKMMEFIYPKDISTIYIPRDFDGKKSEVVLKATHKESNTTLFWYLNDKYIGKTETIHEISVEPDTGIYTITIVDNFGNKITKNVKIENS
ncbi:penicillin-binding protein 1C [Aureivirga sp. CE67]|uniref:penicillin-binding protein 1C n=1 Tax=Aureivirga sp. CE67 TaxID=1788983 RepID=UPI001E4DA69A|nr:penicillin-binding protein 1C [Aureivirga sp. CE67]